jgi:hypothetical protein
MKNRMRELRSFGSVRGEGSNVLAYSENWIETLKLAVSVFHHWALTTRRAD